MSETFLAYLPGMLQNPTGDSELDKCLQTPRHQIWMSTGKSEFDNILEQRIYHPARNVVNHFRNKDYESCVVMCGAIAEMLTYFLFFVHTNSTEPLTDSSSTDPKFDRIKRGVTNCKNNKIVEGSEEKIFKSFADNGDQVKRIKILEESPITKSDYNENGKGHDTKEICPLLKEIHETRIEYFHHWFFEKEEVRRSDAKKCIMSLHKAIGHIFECDLTTNNPGTVMVNASVSEWIKQNFNTNETPSTPSPNWQIKP